MKISIIIPTYNCSKYIEKAIDSVLNQKYVNKELIVVDGNSTDNTIEILKKYQDKIKWISEKDNGQADAINKGFKMASGEIVAWLNADDYYESDIFEKIVAEFKNNSNLSLLYGNCRSVDENGNLIKINKPPRKISASKLIRNGNYIFQPSSFYRKGVVEKINFLDSKLNYWMEYDLYIKLLQNGDGQYIDEILSVFLIRDNQKSNVRNILQMDKELFNISLSHGGTKFSKVYLSTLIRKLKYEKNN
jgi:glycosyltransferase involved in cell wall biosynthesis